MRRLAAILAASLASTAALAAEPVRVGFLTVNTGALAAGGRQMQEGSMLGGAVLGSVLGGVLGNDNG